MTWRDVWVMAIGLAGMAAAVAIVWLVGAAVTRRVFGDEGPFERWEWPLVWMFGLFSLVTAGGLLTAAYELGCVVVGCGR